MRLRVVVGEALRSLGASMSTTVAATLTVLIGMFVLGLTIALGTWVLSWSNHAKSQLLVKVYLCQSGQADCRGDATAKQAEQIRLMLARDARVEADQVHLGEGRARRHAQALPGARREPHVQPAARLVRGDPRARASSRTTSGPIC